ncbi:MAG: hypothetical protein ACK4TL_15775 [Hyphomicrobiaceae bacterium]
MTRSSLRRTLRRAYWSLGLVLLVSVMARLANHIPGLAESPAQRLLADIYDYLKDMALVLVTVIAAYLANVFQKRAIFLNALKEEWRNIVKAKSALFTFTQREAPTPAEYFSAFCAISETIDNMRAVYGNVGETQRRIGLYPYAPLHDMRRALQSIEPQGDRRVTAEDRKLARDAILQSFYALRETFLEELDLEAPDNPLLIHNGRRMKKPGAPIWARRRQARQHRYQDRVAPPDPRIASFLTALYDKEQTTAKPWREVESSPANSPEAPTPVASAPAQA